VTPDDLPDPRRICLIKPSALGDVVTALPVLRALRRRHRDAHIAWVLRDIYAPLIAHDSQLDEVICYDRRLLGRFWLPGAGMAAVRRLRKRLAEGQFDWAIDLQGLARSGYFAKWTRAGLRIGFADARELAPRHYTRTVDVPAEAHTIDRNLAVAAALGCPGGPEDLHLTESQPGRAQADALLDELHIEPGRYFALCPATTWPTKRYPARHWIRVAAGLAESLPVVLLGTGGDRTDCARIAEAAGNGVNSIAGQTGIDGFVAVLATAASVVCCDSSAKFIAQATGTPAACLIGPTRAGRTGLWPKAAMAGTDLVAPVACQGCLQKSCSHCTCMQLIPPGQVVSATLELCSIRSG
jgi:ADP-heptose:LPS heptosyltransferase